METVTVFAPAKINLFLEITGSLPGGYHALDTVMQTVQLGDTVTITQTDNARICLHCDQPGVPTDRSNLAVRAAEAFFAAVGIAPMGLEIHLDKQIPTQAGMGGGSADAAAVLVGLNVLCGTGLSAEVLREIGVQLGADVPFMLYGGCARAKGIGEKLARLYTAWPENTRLVIAKPSHAISTAMAYGRYDALNRTEKPLSPQALMQAMANGKLSGIGAGLFNIFERVCGWPEMEEIQRRMRESGACGALLTGSGSAIFGLFADSAAAEYCAKQLMDTVEHCVVVTPCAHGAKVLSLSE